MSGDADRPFRIPDSTLYAAEADEFDEYDWTDLPYYADFRGSFHKFPWAIDEADVRAAGADVAIVGAPYDDGVSARPGARMGPKAIRSAPYHWEQPVRLVDPVGRRALRVDHGRRRGRRAGGARAGPNAASG